MDDRSLPRQPGVEERRLAHVWRARAHYYGAIPNGPFFQSRSTNDARLFRRYGIPSYGFSPFLVLTTDTKGIGAVNEGIALPAYLAGVELYIDLLRRLRSYGLEVLEIRRLPTPPEGDE